MSPGGDGVAMAMAMASEGLGGCAVGRWGGRHTRRVQRSAALWGGSASGEGDKAARLVAGVRANGLPSPTTHEWDRFSTRCHCCYSFLFFLNY
jgi:hypothetical protein